MDQIQALIQSGQLPAHNFPVTSRYHNIETAMIKGPDGLPNTFLKRRFIPPSEYYSSNLNHRVKQGERLDLITARYLLDPEQFWQISDANEAMKPQELTEEIGRTLRIPQGTNFPGN